ncbi:MAG: HAMP domain-containing histidine kinase [Flavobacteriales bacterium]|nr:HAMP domain-containing histidine kinase [Flavobacteriales bacterium]
MKASAEQAERLHRFTHDLRNRLAGIQQVLGQLQGSPPDDADELLLFAEQQFFKAMRATEDLLDDLHVDRTGSLGDSVRLNLADTIARCIGSLNHRFERKRQTVQLDLDRSLHIQGDEHYIEELVLALLSNASKFSHVAGAIQVSLKAEGGHAVLTVADQGIGLDEEDRKQVFTRYAWLKGRPTTGEAQGRSTLGRARQWAQLHGGELTVASPGPDLGSTFVLRMPVAT